MESKAFTPEVKEAPEKGKALIRFATLDVVDKDGDVTKAGFFGEQHAMIQPAHSWGDHALGKARIFEKGNEALAELHFNLDTKAGADWFSSILFDYTHPPTRQEYSYGFTIEKGGQSRGEFNGQEVRFLQPTKEGRAGAVVHEVSPVLLGAGEGTATLFAKGNRSLAEVAADAFRAVALLETYRDRIVKLADLRSSERGRDLGLERLAELKSLSSSLHSLHSALHDVMTHPPKEPKSAEVDPANLLAQFEATKFRLRQLGITA